MKNKSTVFSWISKNYNWLVYIPLVIILIYPFNISFKETLHISNLLLAILMIFALLFLFLLNFSEIKKNIHKTWIVGVVITVLLMLILIRNGDIKNNHFGNPFFITEGLLLIFLLCNSRKWIKPFFILSIVFTCEHIFFTILFKFTPNFYYNNILPLFPEFKSELIYEFEHGQMAGFTYHYSTNASYLQIGFVSLLCYLFMIKKQNNYGKFAIYALLILDFIALLLTGKRAHVIFLLVSLIIVFIIYSRNDLKNGIVSLLIILSASALFILVISFIDRSVLVPFQRFVDIILMREDVFYSRRPMFQLAIDLFLKSPLIGHGWGTYKYYYNELIVDKERDFMDAHNIYLQMLAEVGILGFILLICLFVFIFILILKNLGKNRKGDSIVYVSLFMLLYILMEGVVGNPIYTSQIQIPFFMMIAGMLSVNYCDSLESKSEDSKVMNKKTLSISVASYNLGDMIEQNIKSFCESSVADDIELIITDDGSKDNTPEIIERYEKLYPKTIKFIKKENEGPGSTVNSGIKHATGKYFRMVDGDDWVDSANLEEFVNLLKNVDTDMIVSDYCIYDNSKKQIIKTEKFSLSKNKKLHIDDVYLQLPNQMHAVTYKTEIYKNNNIVLDNCFYTDVEYLLYPVPYVETIFYFDKPIYIYRIAQAGQSVSPSSMKKNVAQHELVFEHIKNYFEKHSNNMSEGQSAYYLNRLGKMADVQLGTYLLFDPSDEQKRKIKSFISELKNNNKAIYAYFKSSKKCKILVYSNYLLYPLLSRRYTKKQTKN